MKNNIEAVTFVRPPKCYTCTLEVDEGDALKVPEGIIHADCIEAYQIDASEGGKMLAPNHITIKYHQFPNL